MKNSSFEVCFQLWSKGRNEEGANDWTIDVSENRMTTIIFRVGIQIEKKTLVTKGLNFPRRHRHANIKWWNLRVVEDRLSKRNTLRQPINKSGHNLFISSMSKKYTIDWASGCRHNKNFISLHLITKLQKWLYLKGLTGELERISHEKNF